MVVQTFSKTQVKGAKPVYEDNSKSDDLPG